MDSNESGTPKEPEKTLYILKAKPDALVNAETWLKNKGWLVTSTTQIREALTQIVQTRPKYIMICLDHPAPKARMLPKLFESALNTQVIVFLDKSSPSAVAMVAGYQYILYPPVSGPAIDRMCSKIDSDRKRAQEAIEHRERLGKIGAAGGEGDRISVKGSNGGDNEKILIQQQAQKQAQEALKALMKSNDTDDSENETKSGGNKPGGIAYMPPTTMDENEETEAAKKQKGAAYVPNHAESSSVADLKEKKGPAYIPTKESTSKNGVVMQEGNAGESKSATSSGPNNDPMSAMSKGKKSESLSETEESIKSQKSKEDAEAEAAAKKANGKNFAVQDGPDQNKHNETQEGAPELASSKKGAASGGANGEDGRGEIGGSSAPLGGEAQGKAVMRGEFVRPGAMNDRLDKKLMESTQEAIDIAAVANLEAPIVNLGDCDQVVCFPVGTAQKHGYILCAIASSPEPLEKFIPLFRTKLLELMLGVDKHFMAGDPLLLNLQVVPFQAWSQSQATFLKKFVHSDRECAVAFFDQEMPEPTYVPENKHPSMLTVDFQVVQPERKLEFDFFLHFPRNAKFIRYGKRGFIISTKQKDRLVNRGVNWVHMPENQRIDLFRYRLQVFFDIKISEFLELMTKTG